jgi:3-oxoacyl-[acyl-carrier protein] reductase
VKTDVANEKEVIALIEAAVKAFGKVDIAVNNSGVEGTVGKPLHQLTEKEFEDPYTINVKGTFFLIKHEVSRKYHISDII